MRDYDKQFQKLKEEGYLSDLADYDEWLEDLDISSPALKKAYKDNNFSLVSVIVSERQRGKVAKSLSGVIAHIDGIPVVISPNISWKSYGI